jgi:hypothetical protein
MNKPRVNPEIFKYEAPKELISKTYYAYLDSIETVDGTTFLRFDCIEKKIADNDQINKESIIGLPSIFIDISGRNHYIDNLFGVNGIFAVYNFESQWFVIQTTTEQSDISALEFFNFSQVGNEQTFGNYSIASIQSEKETDETSRNKIQEIKSVTRLTESPEEDIHSFIEGIDLKSFSHVNVYNVGQGNCNALVDSHNLPLLYFDVGGGSGANAGSYPTDFKLCHSHHPSIILSHWDLDHIVTAVYDPQLLRTKWLVPIQSSLSNTAYQIAAALQRLGNLTCWNNSIGPEVLLINHIVSKCTARATNKNSSGLALYVNYSGNDYALLSGDAKFYCIPNITRRHLIALVASHHGAKSSIRGMPIAAKPGMLAYSFGVNNTHGHAHCYARNEYLNNGWGTGLETVCGSISLVQSPTYLATPCGGGSCTLSINQHF